MQQMGTKTETHRLTDRHAESGYLGTLNHKWYVRKKKKTFIQDSGTPTEKKQKACKSQRQ